MQAGRWTAGAVASAIWAGAALAACPTGEDLERGLIFEYQIQDQRGPVEHVAQYHRAAGDGIMASAQYPQLTGDPWERYEKAGLLISAAQRRSGAQRVDVRFDDALRAGLPPVPQSEASGVATWDSGGSLSEIRYTLRSGAVEQVSIGDCRYEAFPLSLTESRLQADGSAHESTRNGHYIPELSFFLTTPPRSVEGFTRVRRPSFLERFNWPFRGL